MPWNWKGSDGKKSEGKNFPSSYFEGIFEGHVTQVQFQKRPGGTGGQWIEAAANEINPYDENSRLRIAINIGNSDYPNWFSIKGGTPIGKTHRWADLMINLGLNPEKDEIVAALGKRCKVLIYARVPVRDTGKIYTDIWNVFPVDMPDDTITGKLRFSCEQGNAIANRINPKSYWFTGEPFLKPTGSVKVESEAPDTEEDDMPF